ncbi:uncharacterized protein AB675_2505 [Cyphellophora attinorum]|uniref:Uncharacterized protein n=1 Tax=Cyphellophora attinorum TaxID=1664694 RepID=A0A0N1I0B1_9EURO|nr:uncharacterized protein AB675_2505 [Phialophora attinorum]KPI44845.1 hypothetical protein AB675_2505 [Phialophora attinorum]
MSWQAALPTHTAPGSTIGGVRNDGDEDMCDQASFVTLPRTVNTGVVDQQEHGTSATIEHSAAESSNEVGRNIESGTTAIEDTKSKERLPRSPRSKLKRAIAFWSQLFNMNENFHEEITGLPYSVAIVRQIESFTGKPVRLDTRAPRDRDSGSELVGLSDSDNRKYLTVRRGLRLMYARYDVRGKSVLKDQQDLHFFLYRARHIVRAAVLSTLRAKTLSGAWIHVVRPEATTVGVLPSLS